MQNVVRGSLGNSGKERLLEGEKTGAAGGGGPSPLRTPSNNNSDSKCQAYADLQDKFFTVSGESDSEEGEESEVRSRGDTWGRGIQKRPKSVEFRKDPNQPKGNHYIVPPCPFRASCCVGEGCGGEEWSAGGVSCVEEGRRRVRVEVMA